jgi:hypothetical protein
MPKPLEPAEPVTVFEVSDGGTLRMANYTEAETRAEFYEYVAGFWARSPKDLAEAMAECQPLAWAVQSIYFDFRNELEADLQDAGDGRKRNLSDLKARLDALPKEPEEGAVDWLLSLSNKEFEDRVFPLIETWFGEPPNWNFEDDYLPEAGTAQGAALMFFRDMEGDDLDTLGVDVVEGMHPGSTYYAAELRGDIHEANRTAEEAGIPVRFVTATFW